jgi:hypothetical protein
MKVPVGWTTLVGWAVMAGGFATALSVSLAEAHYTTASKDATFVAVVSMAITHTGRYVQAVKPPQ